MVQQSQYQASRYSTILLGRFPDIYLRAVPAWPRVQARKENNVCHVCRQDFCQEAVQRRQGEHHCAGPGPGESVKYVTGLLQLLWRGPLERSQHGVRQCGNPTKTFVLGTSVLYFVPRGGPVNHKKRFFSVSAMPSIPPPKTASAAHTP